jgi:hypothetical protein
MSGRCQDLAAVSDAPTELAQVRPARRDTTHPALIVVGELGYLPISRRSDALLSVDAE